MNSLKLLSFLPSMNCAQVRNMTWVLKRRIVPALQEEWTSEYIVGDYVKDVNPPADLREDQNLYEVVSKNIRKRPDVSVILLDHVEGLGVAGDIVSVRPGKARWELILPKRAVYKSAFNLEYYKDLIGQKQKVGPSSAIVTYTQKEFENTVFNLCMSAETPWTVEKWHVRACLRRSGVVAPDDAIEMPEEPITGPDPKKNDKVFVVYITINGQERSPVRILLTQTDFPLSSHWHCGKKAPLLKSQADVLDKFPIIEAPKQVTEELFE